MSVALGVAMRVATVAAIGATIAACAGRSSRAPVGSTKEAPGPLASASIDAGVERSCAHGVKDVAPCVEDCDRGIGFACELVATYFEHGEDGASDLTRAVAFHERACELREPLSCVTAARMHASGAGVPPSRSRQIELLANACMLGEMSACLLAARAFGQGNGVAKDARRATDLYERACAGGIEPACESLEDAGP